MNSSGINMNISIELLLIKIPKNSVLLGGDELKSLNSSFRNNRKTEPTRKNRR